MHPSTLNIQNVPEYLLGEKGWSWIDRADWVRHEIHVLLVLLEERRQVQSFQNCVGVADASLVLLSAEQRPSCVGQHGASQEWTQDAGYTVVEQSP